MLVSNRENCLKNTKLLWALLCAFMLVFPSLQSWADDFFIFESEFVKLAITEARDPNDFQNLQSSLWVHAKGKSPDQLLSKTGFEYENLTTAQTGGGTLCLITWRAPSRGQYLDLDLLLIHNEDHSIKKLLIKDLTQEIYAGKASLIESEEELVLELNSALHGHFYSAPYFYQIRRYQFGNESFNLKETKYSRPEDSTQFLNLGKHFLEEKQFERSIHFYVKGLKLQSESPRYIDDPTIAEVQLNLAKAYVGTGDREKSRRILNLLVNSFPQTTYAKRAHRILGKMPK